MNNDRRKMNKPAFIQRKLVRQCITIAILFVVITGCLAAFFYTGIMAKHNSLTMNTRMYDFIPGLFAILLIIFISLILSMCIGYLLFRKSFKLYTRSYRKQKQQEYQFTVNSPEFDNSGEEINPAKPQSPELNPSTDDENILLKDTLASEKLWNNLMLSLLRRDISDNILNTLIDFCKSDYLGYYHLLDTSGIYSRYCYSDANQNTARHSHRLDAIDKVQYQWMIQKLTSPAAFVFNKAMMDHLIEGLHDKDNEAEIWMQTQARDVAEYTLCTHEGWSNFVSIPYLDENAVKGFFLFGFNDSPMPLTSDTIERLTSISTALADRIMSAESAENKTVTTDSIDAVCANIGEAVFITTTEGQITWINPATTGLSGLTPREIINKNWFEVFHLVDADSKLPISNPIVKSESADRSYPLPNNVLYLTPEDYEIPIEGVVSNITDSQGKHTGYIFILRDISSRINDVNEIIKQQKTEAISSLSAGLAHDFNNLLTAILGNISLVLDDLPPDSEHALSLKAAEDCTMKGKEITNRLLTFAKSSPQEDAITETAVNLKKIVTELVKSNSIKPIFRIESNLPPIKMSTTNFEIVLSNIVNNAIQAMKSGGDLTITANAFDNVANSISLLKPGKYVCIHIIDTGDGIPKENLNRIFTPYFSTREGRSGLGLASVNSILAKHGGTIRFHSKPIMGTDCEIYIPSTIIPDTVVSNSDAELIQSKYYMLVLDVDDMLGNLLIKTLAKMEIQVDKTSNPIEIITLYSQAEKVGKQVNLIILNLDVQTESDIQNLVVQLKKQNVNLKIIAYSNHIQPGDLQEFKEKGFDDILLKPFNISDLKVLISRNLEI